LTILAVKIAKKEAFYLVRVELKFVLIALVHDKLCAGCDRENISITPYEVRKWGGLMEQKTGLAVLNGFSPDEILEFLNYSPLFRPDYSEKDCEGNSSFVLNTDALCRMSAYPDIAYCLFVAWDPVLNYPMEFIEASGLLPVLENTEGGD